MKTAPHLIRLVLAGALLASAAACSKPEPLPLDAGTWKADGTSGSLSFVTIKNGDVAEAHVFRSFEGSIAPGGAATLTIDLASVDTGVEIRDERMREVLFEIATYPDATVTAQLDPAGFAALGLGQSMSVELPAKLSLHGATADITADLQVSRLGEDRVEVATRRPIIISAASFGLAEGVENLRELAGLQGISGAVPVSFSITFTR